MNDHVGARIISVPTYGTPVIADDCFVAPGAVLAGNVTLHGSVSIWFNAVLRADYEPIVIGEGSNIQDNVTGHVDTGFPLTLGKNVSVGHNAVIHGCTVEDDCLIGMGATVLNGVVIGTGSLVAAGAVVLEGTIVPPGSLVAGVPAKVRRELTAEEREGIKQNAANYRHRLAIYTGGAVTL